MRNQPDFDMVDKVWDRLLLSRYHRWLAEIELRPDPECRQEADFAAEFCRYLEDHLRDLLRVQRGENPRRLQQRSAGPNDALDGLCGCQGPDPDGPGP